MNQAINIIFDGPPSSQTGRFVEVETDDGNSINAGEWIEREDGLWVLRITELPKNLQQGVEADAQKPCRCCGLNAGDNFCANCGRDLRTA